MFKIINSGDISRGVERCPISLEDPAHVHDVTDFVVSCNKFLALHGDGVDDPWS